MKRRAEPLAVSLRKAPCVNVYSMRFLPLSVFTVWWQACVLRPKARVTFLNRPGLCMFLKISVVRVRISFKRITTPHFRTVKTRRQQRTQLGSKHDDRLSLYRLLCSSSYIVTLQSVNIVSSAICFPMNHILHCCDFVYKKSIQTFILGGAKAFCNQHIGWCPLPISFQLPPQHNYFPFLCFRSSQAKLNEWSFFTHQNYTVLFALKLVRIEHKTH